MCRFVLESLSTGAGRTERILGVDTDPGQEEARQGQAGQDGVEDGDVVGILLDDERSQDGADHSSGGCCSGHGCCGQYPLLL